MKNQYFAEDIVALPGIYAIINMEDMKIYIGQTNSLRDRCYSHYYALLRRIDNNEQLQQDFSQNHRKLLFLSLCSHRSQISDSSLCYLESLFCYIAIQNGFIANYSLYNGNKNETLKVDGKDYFKKKFKKFFKNFEVDFKYYNDLFIEKFEKCFHRSIKDLLSSSSTERTQILDNYLKTEYAKVQNGYFSISANQNLIKIISLDEIPLERTIITKVGQYLDQTIYDILNEKLSDISSNGYCVWALNKLNAETVRHFCTDREVYVFMKYTDSSSNKSSWIPYEEQEEMITSDTFDTEDIQHMLRHNLDPISNLKLTHDSYKFPSTLKHRETCTLSFNYGRAFIIEELFLLKENFPEEIFLNHYYAFLKDYWKKDSSKKEAIVSVKNQHDTSCLQLKETIASDELVSTLKKYSANENETNYLIAKLKKPYFVKLQKDSTLNSRNR